MMAQGAGFSDQSLPQKMTFGCEIAVFPQAISKMRSRRKNKSAGTEAHQCAVLNPQQQEKIALQ
jgi:hypothetical protein